MKQQSDRSRSRHEEFNRWTSLGYVVNHLSRLLEMTLRDLIVQYNVVPGQFAQLLALFEEDDITVNELTERVRMDQSTIVRTLARMERDGLVHRLPDPVDRRRTRITLTKLARDLEPRLVAAAAEVNALATSGMSNTEVATFLQVMARMTEKLENRGDA